MKRLNFLIFALLLVGCQNRGIYSESKNKVAISNEGAVSSAHPHATHAAVEILRAGGNAMDAAIAAAFTLTVVEPTMNGLGGRTQILIYSPETGFHGIDATTTAPDDYDYDNAPKKKYGYPSIGIPGTVKGLVQGHDEFGSLQLSDVMADAIMHAEKGHFLIEGEARRMESVNTQLNEFSGTRYYFTNTDGSPLKSGKLLIQKDLSNVLKAISNEGSSVFYTGWIAKKMVEDNKNNGGVLSMEALASYQAKKSHIVSGSYRGYGLNALWMPAFGAITIEALQILEQLEGDLLNKFDWAESIYEAIDAAYLDRRVQFTLEDARRFTSKAWANKRANEIRNKKISSSLIPLPESYTALHGHTTHLTVADKNGMVVSLTQTIGTTMGSKVATPGLGFMYAQTLGGYLGEVKPGDRASSHISPIIVTREGRPFLAMGAAGGSRIPSSIVAVISRVIDQNLSLVDAMSKPRVHPANDKIEIEIVIDDENKYDENFDYNLSDTLHFTQSGYSVKLRSGKGNFGRVYAIMREGNDWVAVSDPDWQGSSGAVR
tara:strand:+ start:727 stop:2361 length:1635 start_codon:yes stop_codon:yes gene_type:complete